MNIVQNIKPLEDKLYDMLGKEEFSFMSGILQGVEYCKWSEKTALRIAKSTDPEKMEKVILLTETCDYTNVFDVLELFELPVNVIKKLISDLTVSAIESKLVTKEKVLELALKDSTDGDFSKLYAYLDAKYNAADFAPKADANDISNTGIVLSMNAAKDAIEENVYTEEKLLASSRPVFDKLIRKEVINDIKSGKVKIESVEEYYAQKESVLQAETRAKIKANVAAYKAEVYGFKKHSAAELPKEQDTQKDASFIDSLSNSLHDYFWPQALHIPE